MQPLRARGATSHKTGGSAPGALLKYVEWKLVTIASNYAGETASEDAAGVKRSVEMALKEGGVLPPSGQCARSYTGFLRDSRSGIR